jgi:Fur family transcriptional regulator, peroxide stress response regulator
MAPIAETLTKAGIRPSVQRVRILDYLRTKKNHPTVETIYVALAPEIPTLSRTTVYNTLELFRERELVISLDFGEGSVRYDADTSPHVHFGCEKCGAVFDVFIAPEDIRKKLPQGFVLKKTQLYAFGLCAKCAKKEA